jgi:uncharacterized protein (DUF488 family)
VTTVYTIGHSNHPEEHFLALLRRHAIQAVADVRSSPYSRYTPHFDRESLQKSLAKAGVRYVYLGKELGARSDDPGCYAEGRVQFARLARTPLFQSGLARVRGGMARHRIALMCAEKEPLDCHRTILVARHLAASGVEIQHILADGALETHAAALERLAASLPIKSAELHLFRSEEELLDDTYELQERRIAFRPAADAAEQDRLLEGIA